MLLRRNLTTGVFGQYLVLLVTCHATGSAYLYNYLSLVPFPMIVGKCDTSQRSCQYSNSSVLLIPRPVRVDQEKQ